MEEIKKILAYNKQFVEEKRYEQYSASKFPNKKLAIVTCMDTRLVELLPAALGLKNGDVKMIKNAGGVVTSPFGSVIRSLLVAIIELGVTDIMVIGHTDCGVQHIDSEMMIHHMKERGITQESIDLMKYCGTEPVALTTISGLNSCTFSMVASVFRKTYRFFSLAARASRYFGKSFIRVLLGRSEIKVESPPR